jgi:hypothetical protein
LEPYKRRLAFDLFSFPESGERDILFSQILYSTRAVTCGFFIIKKERNKENLPIFFTQYI